VSKFPTVSAPGKAFLIGEYAVLEGVAAVVTAVDVRAVAHTPREGEGVPPTAVVECADRRAAGWLEERGATGDAPAPPHPVVETGGFTFGPRKLGLGSSAAVAAAVVGYRLAAAGLDPSDPELRADALALARAAHAEAQGGGGSGADVAAAVLGGTLRFQEGRVAPVELPAWLAVGFWDSGAPAVTQSFVEAVRRFSKRDPAAYRAAIGHLREASERFFGALGRSVDEGFPEIVDACQAHVTGLRALQAGIEVPILTPAIETILEEATAAGLAAKPSGAGGGDLVVVFAPQRAQLDRLAEPLRRDHGLAALAELRCGAEGLRAEERLPTNSRLAGFFKLSVEARRIAVATATGLEPTRLAALDAGSLDLQRANHMIENVVGTLALPLAIATNFRVNGRDVLVPMAVEEASVVAAASNAAKMIRAGGGFAATSDPPWMIAQVQLVRRDPAASSLGVATEQISGARGELLALADGAHPRLVERGGGARDLEIRPLADDMLAVHVLVDCQDAMGANLVNTVAETLAPSLERLTGWEAGLRILSNLADRRCAHVSARIPPEALVAEGRSGSEVVDAIVSASRFAELDPYRAATHNKGIMNGVDAVVLATGNDWRAMEASAHAYAARSGRYAPLAVWRRDESGWLHGTMTLPAAVGVVGGATKVNPVATLALEILGCTSGVELGQIMAAAGLASNLAALRALATDGIQRGHMSLHARSIALAAGASGREVEALATALVRSGEIKVERAIILLRELRSQAS
jgi:degradative hydroxymethylglutaryl-CoA reductase